ncbi:hypothetical protein PISL3812_09812 [Talaromyces islandicus]|uniref:Uncharacterized protein n=1 Tax=Talaromyces islandicus TaxID=28573 RepID=A0A0U1MB25_TALIS|nr:hypothetical protein PISL3812_09812 [Talaromyces islandicus]
MLATLPSELLGIVIGQTVSRRDLKHLCEVCKRLHDIVTPHLYRSLILSAPELSLKDLVAILETIPSKYLKYTQDFGFSVPIHERVESRCVHHSSNEPFIDETLQDGLAKYLTNGGNMGSEDLDDADKCSVDLVQFRDLRSLAWKGLNRYNDFESVRECMEVHGHQIQSLTLDLLTWDRAEEIWAYGFLHQTLQRAKVPDNFFSERVLNIHPRDRKVTFSSLENLHLSAVSFYHAAMEMAHAFNIERLNSLKLRNCPGSLHWLQMILDSRKPMKLKSLELALDLNSLQRDTRVHITETICNFIYHVPSLESLYLMLPEPIDWTALTERLSTHCQLKRFVMHHLVDRGGQNLIDGDIL